MEVLRAKIRDYLIDFLGDHLSVSVYFWYNSLILIWLIITSISIHFILRSSSRYSFKKYLHKNQSPLNNNTKNTFLLTLLSRISFVIQGFIFLSQARLWLTPDSKFLYILEIIASQWILLFSLLSLFSILDIFQVISDRKGNAIHFPVRGLLQTIKLIASFLVGIIAVSFLLDKSPLILFSGLGALSAILLLVFKDPILGLVAGIQLSANNMLSVGDWLEMPKYGADGDVIDIALTTVKVKNWDKTITTIPTYALISDSFKNWRGMSESGGRRIKRSIRIEMSSVCFLNNEQLAHLAKADLLTDYIKTQSNIIERNNIENKTDMSVLLNGRRLTNLGTFRHYLLCFLKSNPKIHKDMTLIVRQLEPDNNGLAVEIYAFTNTTNWNEYEDIQSDIFDHILATLPVFSLRAHESPTGNDIRALTK